MAGGRSEMLTIGHAVIPLERLHHTRLVAGTWILCALLLAACVKPPGFPPLGDPLPASAKLAADGQEPAASMEPNQAGQLGAPSASASTNLRFKATLLDENGNLFLESGEQIRVRVDVVNTGSSPIQNASASLTGTPSVIEQFTSTRLTIPPLQPGETKSLEFTATLPSSLQPQQVEIRVSVTESGGAAARPQALLFIIQPAGPL